MSKSIGKILDELLENKITKQEAVTGLQLKQNRLLKRRETKAQIETLLVKARISELEKLNDALEAGYWEELDEYYDKRLKQLNQRLKER